MTQWIRSLITWLIDLKRRSFDKEYWVKAKGKSPKKHNFRMCPKCKDGIPYLDPVEELQQCQCGAILCRSGVYEDKRGRKYVLPNVLHSKTMARWALSSTALLFLWLLVYRIKLVPEGYLRDSGLSLFLTFAVFTCSMSFLWTLILGHLRDFKKKLIAFFFIIVTSLIFVGGVVGVWRGIMFVPVWIEIPTQEQWDEQQYKKLQNMPYSESRYFLATKITSRDPRVEIEAEALGFMRSDPEAAIKFIRPTQRFERKSPEEKEFYYLYKTLFLERMEPDRLKFICAHTGGHLFNPYAAANYPDTWAACGDGE